MPRPLNTVVIKSIVEQPQGEYHFSRKPFANQDSVPINFIGDVIKHHFGPNSRIIHYFASTILLVAVPVRAFLNAPIQNWCQNRQPDLVRIPDIAQYIYQKKAILDTIPYISYKNKKDCFDIIDGIHRFNALKHIFTENSKTVDLLDSVSELPFGANGDALWLYNSEIVINVRFNASIGELIELRDSLNRCQPMPTVLMDDESDAGQERKQIIEAIATEWQQKYKKNFSSSSDPAYLKNNGQTNRPTFIALLGELYDKYNIDSSRINVLNDGLHQANELVRDAVLSKGHGSMKARERAKETGCYLFIYRNDKLLEMF